MIKRDATPNGLYAAGWWEDLEILDSLIRAGAPIDVTGGETPFLACWKWRKFKAAKFLARNGADVNFQDARGKTALHHGVQKEFDPDLLRWLIGQGGSPDRLARILRAFASRSSLIVLSDPTTQGGRSNRDHWVAFPYGFTE